MCLFNNESSTILRSVVYYEGGQYRRISYVRVENERWLLFPSDPRKAIWLAKVRTLHVLGYHPRVAAGIPRCRHVCRYIVCMCLRSDLIVRRGQESEVHIALIFPRGCDKQSAGRDTQRTGLHRRRSSRHCTCSRSWRRSLQGRCCGLHTTSTRACWCLRSCQQSIARNPSRARLSTPHCTHKHSVVWKLRGRRSILGTRNTLPSHCRPCTCPRRKLCSWPRLLRCTRSCRRSLSPRHWPPANGCVPDSLCTPRCRAHTCICRQHTPDKCHRQGRNTLRCTRSL